MSFRTILAGLAAAAVALPAMASPCLQPAEQSGFHLHAFQSQLMVAALNCRQEDGYNSFVRRFQPDLRGAYRHVNNHFRRAGGVRKLDEYITNLANAQSQEGIRQGAAFCNNMAPVWQQVLALPNGRELARYASERPQPSGVYNAEACPIRSAAARPRR